MIKVYKDILDSLGIENVFLTGENNAFCTVLEFSDAGLVWTVATDKEFYQDSVILNIRLNGNYLEIKAEIERLENGLYKLRLEKSKKKQFILLTEKIQELEEHHELWEKRKEERFNIGLNYTEEFLLSKPEQTVIFNKRQLPCLINNISFSGANITTASFNENEFKRGGEIFLILKFHEPIEQIAVKGTIQSIAIKSAKNTNKLKFAIIAIQIINPPLSYKERITTFIKKRGA